MPTGWGALGGALGAFWSDSNTQPLQPTLTPEALQEAQAQIQQASLQAYATTTTANTWSGSGNAIYINQDGSTTEVDGSIRISGENATIDFDGIKITKQDVVLLLSLIKPLRAAQERKKASEKDMSDAIKDAVKELGG